MRLGGASLRVTGVLAAGRRRRRLRSDLRASKQVLAGEATYVVRVPGSSGFLRVPDYGWEALSVFDGTRTDAQAVDEINRRNPKVDTSLADLQDFLDTLGPEIWEPNAEEKGLAIVQKLSEERRQRLEGSVFHMTFSAWDPDPFFERVIPYLRFFFTRGFLIASVAIVALAAVLFVYQLDRIARDTAAFYTFTGKSAAELFDFWLILAIVGFIHESAHGLTCKAYGGEVRQMGFMLVYFTPCFFVDVTDITLFDRKWKRVMTMFAGVWIETVLSAICLFVWALTASGTALNDWAYKVMLMTSITGIIVNLLPLMKFDGYYILCELVDIDDLMEDSSSYLKQWFLHFVSGGREAVERVSRRKHWTFVTYGTLSLLYTTTILTLILLWFKNLALRQFGSWGWLVTAAAVWLVLRKPILSLAGFLKEQAPRAKETLMGFAVSGRRRIAAGAGAALLLCPAPTRVTTDFVLEPGVRAAVRAVAEGTIAEVRVREGQAVAAGELLAVLQSPEVQARARTLELRVLLSEQALRSAQSRGDRPQAEVSLRELQRLATESAEASRIAAGLELRSPIAGIVATPDVEQQVGEYLHTGDALCEIVDRGTMRARVLVRDSDLEDVASDSRVRLQVRAHPLRAFSGRVRQILPAAAADRPLSRPLDAEREGQQSFNYFAVTLEFSNADGRLYEGMTGTAKLHGRWRLLGWQAMRGGWRWARSQMLWL